MKRRTFLASLLALPAAAKVTWAGTLRPAVRSLRAPVIIGDAIRVRLPQRFARPELTINRFPRPVLIANARPGERIVISGDQMYRIDA